MHGEPRAVVVGPYGTAAREIRRANYAQLDVRDVCRRPARVAIIHVE